MRTIRTLATGLLSAVLLGGISSAGAAHLPGASPGPDPMAAAYVTGELGAGEGTTTAGEITTDADGVIRTRGATMTGLEVTSSDPRLGGAYSYVGNSDRYPGDIVAQVGGITIRDDRGGWVGTSTEYNAWGHGDMETIEFAGEGAYAGLTAHLVVNWGSPARPFTGIIFPGEMPDAPAAP